jgi:hypothetical protein
VIAAATTNAIWLMRESRFEVRFAPINGNGQHRGARLLSAKSGCEHMQQSAYAGSANRIFFCFRQIVPARMHL